MTTDYISTALLNESGAMFSRILKSLAIALIGACSSNKASSNRSPLTGANPIVKSDSNAQGQKVGDSRNQGKDTRDEKNASKSVPITGVNIAEIRVYARYVNAVAGSPTTVKEFRAGADIKLSSGAYLPLSQQTAKDYHLGNPKWLITGDPSLNCQTTNGATFFPKCSISSSASTDNLSISLQLYLEDPAGGAGKGMQTEPLVGPPQPADSTLSGEYLRVDHYPAMAPSGINFGGEYNSFDRVFLHMPSGKIFH